MSGEVYVPTDDPSERSLRDAREALYGRERTDEAVWTVESIKDYWVGEWLARVHADADAVVLTWGPPGSGKSTCQLDMARRLDPTFTPATLAERVAFRANHLPTLYKRTPRFGACIVDEAVSAGLLSTEHFTPDQRDLVELINLIRAKNVVLFIALPDPSDLAKSFRARRADYRIEVEKEGTDDAPVGHVGRRVRGRKFFLDEGKWLGFSDDRDANPLRWNRYSDSSDPTERALWAAYLPLKMKYLDDRVRSIETRMRARADAREGRSRGG